MSTYQNLAEHGTAFCVAALGLATGGIGAFLIPGAVLLKIGYDIWTSSDKALFDSATLSALSGLTLANDISENDANAALHLLKHSKKKIRFEPKKIVQAISSDSAPDVVMKDFLGEAIEREEPGVKRALSVTLETVFDVLRKSPKYRELITQEAALEILRDNKIQFERLDSVERSLERLESKVAESSKKDRLVNELLDRIEDLEHKRELSENLVIALAHRCAQGFPESFEDALQELERALELAASAQDLDSLPSNIEDAVKQVFQKLDALNSEGNLDEASAEGVRAFSANQDAILAAQQSGELLYRRVLTQAILARSVTDAVAIELKKLGNKASCFDSVHSVGMQWHRQGHDKRSIFDLEVAISLAGAC